MQLLLLLCCLLCRFSQLTLFCVLFLRLVANIPDVRFYLEGLLVAVGQRVQPLLDEQVAQAGEVVGRGAADVVCEARKEHLVVVLELELVEHARELHEVPEVKEQLALGRTIFPERELQHPNWYISALLLQLRSFLALPIYIITAPFLPIGIITTLFLPIDIITALFLSIMNIYIFISLIVIIFTIVNVTIIIVDILIYIIEILISIVLIVLKIIIIVISIIIVSL